jgi:hypothetical protein
LDDLLQGSEYRRKVASDPTVLVAQLRFYANKPIYVALVMVAIAAGVNAVKATFLVSAIAYGLLSIALLLVLRRSKNPWFACTFGLLVLLSPAFREGAGLGTPDMLSALVLVAAGALWIPAARPRLAIALFAISLAIRPDNLLIGLALLAWGGYARVFSRRSIIVAAGALIVVLACLVLLTHPYSWNTLATHTFVRRVLNEQTASGAMTPVLYLKVFGKALGGAFVLLPATIWLFGALSLTGILRNRGTVNEVVPSWTEPRLLGALWSAIFLHFIGFPMLADRFFLAHYALITVAIVAVHDHVSDLRAAIGSQPCDEADHVSGSNQVCVPIEEDASVRGHCI